jgi:hypothetical protein
MKSIARYLIRLYPPTWRARYGEELAALLEDSPPGLSSVLNVLKGAIKMQLSIPSFPKLTLLLSITGLLCGALVAYLMPDTYVSTATLKLEGVASPLQASELLAEWQNEVLSRTSLSSIITDPRLDLYRSQRARQPIEDVIQTMRNRDIRIQFGPFRGVSFAVFTISFVYRDRMKAQETVQALVAHLIEAGFQQRLKTQSGNDDFARLEARVALLEKRLGLPPSESAPSTLVASAMPGVTIRVLDPPSLAVKPAKPNRALIASWGFAIGFLAALIIAVIRRRVRPAVPA